MPLRLSGRLCSRVPSTYRKRVRQPALGIRRGRWQEGVHDPPRRSSSEMSPGGCHGNVFASRLVMAIAPGYGESRAEVQ